MIKIIREGKKEFTAICPICSCEFSYELEDLLQEHAYKIVKCPCCGQGIIHIEHEEEDISKVAEPKSNTINTLSPDPTKIWDNMLYQTPEYKKLQKALEKQLKQPSYVDYNKPKSPCETCSHYLKLQLGEIYVGDSPCQWCQYSGLKITCTSTGSSVNGAK